jgi:hypothetical protein
MLNPNKKILKRPSQPSVPLTALVQYFFICTVYLFEGENGVGMGGCAEAEFMKVKVR